MQKSIYSLLSLSIVLSSCASMKEAWVAQNCSENAAYAQGMNDGRDEKKMNVDSYGYCDANKEMVMGSYRKGYENGIASNQPGATTPAAANNGTIINVGIGNGIQVGTGTPGQAMPVINPRAWFCEVTAFEKTYSAFGATKLEASQSLLQQCTREQNEMFCKDMDCKLNR